MVFRTIAIMHPSNRDKYKGSLATPVLAASILSITLSLTILVLAASILSITLSLTRT
jgi:hypothetical protein